MKRTLFLIFSFSHFLILLTSCGHKTQRGTTRDTIPMQPCPKFVAANAMRCIKAQCDLGPRVPGSKAWQQCGDSIVAWFSALGLTVEEQRTEVSLYDGTKVPCRNIIAQRNPSEADRILLCAHWDSRPWADNDADPANHHTPVPAANDGASGVAVMLELARILASADSIPTGIDFVCFDVEDAGTPQWADDLSSADTWCLGSTYWAEQAFAAGYPGRFGILFDMVGGRGSTFSREGYSMQYAQPVTDMLWHIAQQNGYGHYFPLSDGNYITDDHVAVNQIARVPCIDIVPYHTDGPSSFGPTWHTLQDTPENIDPNVLEAVGQCVLQLIYNDAK
ncbi:MAG: M28 family peptidase [Bacteroidaceae bacterium]|nr:M28 family peptidase [Bacteroidaceae bacterium]